MRDVILKGARFLALFLFVVYTFSFAASYIWFADLFRHFVFQYLIGAVFLSVVLLIFRSKLLAGLIGITSCACLLEVVITTPQATSSITYNNVLKIAHYNKLFQRSNHDHLVEWIKHEQPDILVIQEADAETLNRVIQMHADYPYQKWHIFKDNPFGFIFLSKHPIVSYDQYWFENPKIKNPFFNAVVSVHNQAISIYSAHPVPPINYIYTMQRNDDLSVIADFISKSQDQKIIFLGDFNITAYSPYFQNLLYVSGLKNEYTSYLAPPTWPSGFFDYIFQISIDHILHKGALELIEKRRGHHLGSDHYSLIATYGLK